MSIRKLAFFSSLFALVLSGCSPTSGISGSSPTLGGPCTGSEPSEDLEVLVVTVSSGVTSLPYTQWARDSGCFEAHGLEVVIQTSSTSSVDKFAAIIGGSSDVGIDGVTEVVPALVNDSFSGSVRVIANGYGYSESELDLARQGGLQDGELKITTALLGRPGQGFNGLSDLRGRKVGLSTAGSSALGLRLALSDAGVPEAEVEFIDLGSSERVVALDRGDIDFAVLSGTVASAQVANGAPVILYPGGYLYQGGSVMLYYSTADRVKEKEAEMAAFQRAMSEVNAWLSDPSNEEAFKTYLAGDFGLDPDEAARFKMPNFSMGIPPRETLEAYRAIMRDSGLILSDQPIPPNAIWAAPE